MSTKANKNSIKCAVFDLDGTLLNTIKTINYYLNFALEKQGLVGISEDKCREFVGDGAVKLVRRALNHLDCKEEGIFEKVFADYNQAYNLDPYYLTEVYDGVDELLSRLKEGGTTLAVLSNKPDFATRATVSRFFPSIFDICYGAREGIALKPDSDALLLLLREIGVTPESTAYIGDSEPDILTAKNAAVKLPISVTWGFRSEKELKNAGAEIFARHPSEIFTIIADAK